MIVFGIVFGKVRLMLFDSIIEDLVIVNVMLCVLIL